MHCRLGQTAAAALVAVVALYSTDTRAQTTRGCATEFKYCDGCATYTTISVQSGQVCTIAYRPTVPGDRSRISTIGVIYGQKVVARPRSGIYGTANETMGAYKANDGFVGNDAFEVDIEYERSGQRFVTHLKANVVVHP